MRRTISKIPLVHALLLLSMVLYLGTGSIVGLAIATETRTGISLSKTLNSLTNHQGQSVDITDYNNKYLLVYFGYTHCPDVCPTGLQVISYAMKLLQDKANAIIPVFITLDPDRDNTEVMKNYVNFFYPTMVGMTGTEESIKRVTDQFGVRHYKTASVITGKQGNSGDLINNDYLISHTADTFLIDPQGKLLRKFSGSTLSDEMASEIRKFLAK